MSVHLYFYVHLQFANSIFDTIMLDRLWLAWICLIVLNGVEIS